MRTDFNEQHTYDRAVRDFVSRLSKGGASVSFDAAAIACMGMGFAKTRRELLSQADVVTAFLSAKGAAVDKNLALEAAAAFFGTRNWDTLSASLPRHVESGAEVASSADTLHLFERHEGRTPLGDEALWWYAIADYSKHVAVIAKDDCIVVRGVSGDQVIDEVTFAPDQDGFRKEAEWHANIIISRLMFGNFRAAAAFFAGGFRVSPYAGTFTAWHKRIVVDGHELDIFMTDAGGKTHEVDIDDEVCCAIHADGNPEGLVKSFNGVYAAVSGWTDMAETYIRTSPTIKPI
jgi:hypothetical protein